MAEKTAVDIISKGVQKGASDVHIIVNCPPVYRVNGRLLSYPEDASLDEQDIKKLAEDMMPNDMIRERFNKCGQVDFALSFPGVGRARINLYIQRGVWAVAVRIIPVAIPQLGSLGLPPIVRELSVKERGLILVTGATGSGKSTTLAGMLDFINHTRECNVITLEDPIEYLHQHGTCIINQREIGSDTPSFAQGLRSALRQDPDIIMVGEMRDLETISIAITAAETGHLVLASLHSGGAVPTLERIIDVFPPHQQPQVRLQLATCLLGIISQQLIPSREGDSRLLAAEILVMNSAIRNMIRANKIHQIYSAIQTGGSQGMISMYKAVQMLSRQNKISPDTAYKVSEEQGVYI